MSKQTILQKQRQSLPTVEMLLRFDERMSREEDYVDNPTNAVIAKMLKISEPYLYRVLRDKTANRELAERLAELKGGKPSDYLRAPRRRGRPPMDLPFPFRDFVMEANETAAGTQREPVDRLACILAKSYGSREDEQPPNDFESMEVFINFMNAESLGDEVRLQAPLLWRRFKSWRVEQAANHIRYDLDMGDAFSDYSMRQLLSLCG